MDLPVENCQNVKIVTKPKSMCLMFQKAKSQNVKSWRKEMFIDQEDMDQDNGRPTGA